MKNFITIFIALIVFLQSALFAQNQKMLLIGECDKTSTLNMLNYLDKRANISLSVDNNITLSSNNISSYPIILVCNNDYLKLNNDDASLLQNHLKQGGLLILDNITSNYTFSIFLDKILPQSQKKSLSLGELFIDNPFNINPDVRILGADHEGKKFTGYELNLKCVFNSRDHGYSTSELRKRVYNAEKNRLI